MPARDTRRAMPPAKCHLHAGSTMEPVGTRAGARWYYCRYCGGLRIRS